MIRIYFLRVCDVEQIVEVICRTFHQVGIFEIFEYRWHEFHSFMGMGIAKVRIVIDDCFSLIGKFHPLAYLFQKSRIQGEIRPEYDNVVFLNERPHEVESFFGKLVVEHVSSFVILVEESQRDGCFPFAKNIQILGTNAIFFMQSMMMSPTVSFPISLMNVAGTPNLPSEMSVLNVEPPGTA